MPQLLFQQPLALSFGAGVLLHVALLKNIELDVYIAQFLISALSSVVALASAHAIFGHLTIIKAISASASETASFSFGLFTSIVIYRLFFHRLRKFPSPYAARISRFYALYLSARNVRYYEELEKLHQTYGDFVRTGPREISIVRKSAIPLILSPQSDCLKSTWYNQVSPKGERTQLFFSRDVNDHRRRRRAWDRGLNVKSLGVYQPKIKSKVDLLIEKFYEAGGRPMDATAWTMMLAFDIMGDVGYGKDFGGLVSGKEHPAAKAIHDHMTILGTVGMTPWLLYLIQFIPGASAGYAPFFKWCAQTILEKKATLDPEKYPQDISSWLIKAILEHDSSAPPTEDAMRDDARLIIIAGSDTSATANAHTLYYLAKNPHILRKLQAKLDAVMPNGAQDWTYEKIKSVTYVDDIVNESLRLKPPVISGAPRVTPAAGLQVEEVYIPGDVNVLIPFQLIQTDERYFPRAHEFIPERWAERKEEMGTDVTVLIPFGGGVYKCPGNNLAMMSMRTTISCIAQHFDISFAPGETGQNFEVDRKDAFTSVLPPLQLQFTPRKK